MPKQEPQNQAPFWTADHYSAPVGEYVLHIHRVWRRKKDKETAQYQTYEYYTWRVVSCNHREWEAGRGVALTREQAEDACYAVVKAVQGLPEKDLMKHVYDGPQFDEE